MSESREKIADLIKRLGHPPAIINLDPQYQIFTIPSVDGFIGYRLESKCAVVTGDPVCADSDIPELTIAFHEYCKEKGWGVIYLVASEQFRKWAMGKVCHASIHFGDEYVIDPANDPAKGRKGEKLRWKVHKAVEEEVVVHEYTGNDIDLEADIELTGRNWLRGRKGPQIYLAHLDIFDTRTGKRWFYAKKGDRIVGLVILNRVDKHRGWVLNMLMALNDAPVGTSELLMMSVVERLREEGCHFFALGAGPGKTLGDISGLSTVSALIARGCYKIAHRLFRLHTHNHFLKKFLPAFLPSYLMFSRSKIGINEIIALKKSTNVSF